jgi:hypothetical protein
LDSQIAQCHADTFVAVVGDEDLMPALAGLQ